MRTPLVQKAVDAIKERMINGDLTAGTRLSNRQLAAELGISRTPVREALSHLANSGLVEQVPGIGAFVSTPDRAEIEELFEFREALECVAVRKATRRHDKSAIRELYHNCDRLGSLLQEMEAGNNDKKTILDRATELDREFHSIIIAAGGNRWSRRLTDEMQILSEIFLFKRQRQIVEGGTLLEHIHHVLAEHSRILEAIVQQNTECAVSLLSTHIRNYPKAFGIDADNHSNDEEETALTAEQLEFLRSTGNQKK